MWLRGSVALVLSFALISCSYSSNDDQLEIIFVGDVLLDRGVRERIEKMGVESIWDDQIKARFQSANYVVANLECPVTKIVQPINKKFIFRGEPEWLASIQGAGITHLNLANNHSMDQGRVGLIDTDKMVRKYGMKAVGFGENFEKACAPLLLCNSDAPIYLLSSVQVPSENWVFLPNEPCVCEATSNELIEIIKGIKTQEPKAKVLVQLHWGAEHTSEPRIFQIKAAHELVDAGADAIIGHHSHTIQTMEYYKGVPIFYSLGNFIFDQSNLINSKGLMVTFRWNNEKLEVKTDTVYIDKCRPSFIK
jgi:poly-gamma-glutamate capsule biosynthesis protein CapA/YwtB (metallophosphatase superfamily)